MRPSRRSGGARPRGFTLIELMVSLMAGLTVALAVVALSAEATNVFHEEARTAAAEMSLRTAVARLQADFQRAGFMSTGNIQTDPFIAHAPGSPNMAKSGTFNALYRLAGIHLYYQGSLATTPLSASQGLPPITPDMVELSGNYTTTDELRRPLHPSGGFGVWRHAPVARDRFACDVAHPLPDESKLGARSGIPARRDLPVSHAHRGQHRPLPVSTDVRRYCGGSDGRGPRGVCVGRPRYVDAAAPHRPGHEDQRRLEWARRRKPARQPGADGAMGAPPHQHRKHGGRALHRARLPAERQVRALPHLRRRDGDGHAAARARRRVRRRPQDSGSAPTSVWRRAWRARSRCTACPTSATRTSPTT